MKRFLTLALVSFTGLGAVAQTNQSLPLAQARELALRQHPKISAADLKALAAKEKVTEARSSFFPSIVANATAASVNVDNTRIAAGGLNNPVIFERQADGLTVNQVITDFGRTANLSESSKLQARAENANAQATREEILYAVDKAYFGILEAQQVKKVAEQTVENRKLVFDQVSVLASNKIKSDLDRNFAEVTFQEGKLLLLRAENDLESGQTLLSTLLGERDNKSYVLVDEPEASAFTEDTTTLLTEALRQRPDLASLRLQRDAALKFAHAEGGLNYPTVAAFGTAGIIPVHDTHLRDNFAAAGVNVSLPLFAGGLYSARHKEAELLARRSEAALRDAENNVISDVRTGTQNVRYSLERLQLTKKLLETSTLALDLAKARYNLGSSSIVELSQAQLNQTAAEISYTSARYEFLIQRAGLYFKVGRYVAPNKISSTK